MSLNQVYPEKNPEASKAAKVDIILVHGLNPRSREDTEHAMNTWTQSGRLWPKDDLPKILPDARISLYIYDSSAVYGGSQATFADKADELLETIRCDREDWEERPLILMGHSLGGILIEQALINARQNETYQHIYDATACLAFFGTPHEGGSGGMVRAGKTATKIALRLGFQQGDNIIETLDKGSMFTDILQNNFRHQFDNYRMVSFWGDRDEIVPRDSSRFGLSARCERIIELKADHHSVAAFGYSPKDEGNLRKVTSNVKWLYKEALGLVKNIQKRLDIAEKYRAIDTSTTSYRNKHWMVPLPMNDLFTGRSDLLCRIKKALYCDHTSVSDKQKRFVITGLGGQGKSEICLKVANEMRQQFWGVFWVNADNPSTAESDFIAIAKRFGETVKSVAGAVQVLASTEQTWLLILDNADNPKFDYQFYFPSGACGAVLMTSRISECKAYSRDAYEALDGLKEEDSKELLFKAAEIPEESRSSYSEEAKQIVQLLGSHTLALIQAGAYIARGYCQFREYPEVYRRQRKQPFQDSQPNQASSRYHDVYTTFEASAAILQLSESEAAKDALRLLEILSMLDFTFLPFQIFESAWNGGRAILNANGKETSSMIDLSRSHVRQSPSFLVADGEEWNPDRLNAARCLLISLSLVTRHNSPVGVSMHPLTHAWCKDRLGPKGQGVAWIAAGCVLANSRSELISWNTQRESLPPHIIKFLDIDFKTTLGFASETIVMPILLNCFQVLTDMQHYSDTNRALRRIFANLGTENLPLVEQCIKLQAEAMPANHPKRLDMQHVLALIYQNVGMLENAVKILEDVVQIEEEQLKEDDPSRLESMQALALAHDMNGQQKQAFDILEQVIKIRRKTLAPDDRDLLESQSVLAKVVERMSG
ncbi:hypothetical protein HYFRA_00011951 [Hymenoscyphus fraxineus]|uniref:NB-ARC domain-containing protein n=1 Tax=Hymenoscyphus fraxineus TaxID=746836 RepID=A0A9N9L2Q4_9HELO|nr:hypothetical protein HYFRA_00011951 [Hymenoscyphus fraxineus]